ncbi:MAG: hypothetical protein PUC73_05165 [Lachnospiraceae bacterium]|nr:hypothetical protein [Lachnospiraceae bacterium]
MSDNKALLSQEEIDALVGFLKTKDKITNDVLDQGSIDRLVEMLNGARTNDGSNAGKGRFFGNSVLSVEKDIAVQREQCRLLYEKDGDGYAHIVCENFVTGIRYEITPECLNQSCLVESTGEGWGFAIMPVLFDLAAMQLQVKYSGEVFAKVCNDYGKLLFGKEDVELPNAYLPTAARVLDNIVK